MIEELLARCTLPPPGTSVRCGVSGGADSSALLVLAVSAGCDVTAVHVDHRLRAGSDTEAEVVAALARRFGAGFEAITAPVEPGPNLEARARQARHAALGADALLGHTLDDQAETVLLALLRGAGPAGLAGIDPARRPLLALRRSETEALCRHLGINPVHDPSNADPRFRRNRMRHEVLPLLDEVMDRDVAPLLAATAARQRDVVHLVDRLAAGVDPTDGAALTAAPAPVAAQALRRWWTEQTGIPHGPDAAALARMLEVASGGRRAADVVAGWRVLRTAGRLRLERAAPAAPFTPGGAGGG